MVTSREARKYGRTAVGCALFVLAMYKVVWDASMAQLHPEDGAGSATPTGRYRVPQEPAALPEWMVPPIGTASTPGQAIDMPGVRLYRMKLLRFPGAGGAGHLGDSDSNSPAHWDDDTFYLLNSAARSWRSSGPDLRHIDATRRAVTFDREINGGRWIESTWKAGDGTLYGWYHNEPSGLQSSQGSGNADPQLTAPRIGAARSEDNGATWRDLGIILEAPPGSLKRDTHNRYFEGGNGDFSVIPDQRHGYFCFLFSTYHRDLAEQGVSIARMRAADRDRPGGRVRKWHAGRWTEPGRGGRVTPIFPAVRDWHGEAPDAFWGASVHWNTHLQHYVVLLNRAMDPAWTQEGIYITFNADLAHPGDWTQPLRILSREQIISDPVTPTGWYPQVMGQDKSRHETDKLAGRAARLFIHGRSRWEIRFSRPGEGG